MNEFLPPPRRPAAPAIHPELLARSTDGLTGLLTRDTFLEALARRHKDLPGDGGPRPFALLAIDLDRFRWVNATFGHTAGDALLCAAARRMRSRIRAGDVVGRMGGDEFAILLPELFTEHDATGLAARLVELMALPFLLDGHAVVTGCSIGVALFPADAMDATGLLRCAESALSQAKSDGRSGARRFAPAPAPRTRLLHANEIA